MARPSGRPIRDELIEQATALIKEVGVTGFSYGDLAKRLGIKAPSIHHHFKTKEDLVAEVVSLYRIDFASAVEQITDADPMSQIFEYAELFAKTAQTDNLCLCGAVSADWMAVGERSRSEVSLFFDEQIRWLEHTLGEAVKAGQITSELPLDTLSAAILSILEGSLLLARASGDASLPADTIALISRLLTES